MAPPEGSRRHTDAAYRRTYEEQPETSEQLSRAERATGRLTSSEPWDRSWLAPPASEGPPVRRRALAAALVVANIVAVSMWLVYGQGPNIQPAGWGGLLPEGIGVVLWWSSPALVLLFHRTWAGTLLTGITLLVASNVALFSIYSSQHSTAGIGFLVLPSLGWVMGIVLLGAEWIFRRPWIT